MIRHNKAQSILEYVIVLTAVVGVILWAAATYIRQAASKTVQDANTAISNIAGKF